MVVCRHQQQLKNIYEQITDTSKDIDRALELLERQGAPKATRIWRAWFSGVGKVSQYVFGTLDEAAEEEIEELIEGAEDKTRPGIRPSKNQTEVVYKEFGAIQMKTEELERKTQHQQDSQKEAALIVATQLLEENVLQYETDVQTLTDVILFAQKGSIHPRFLNLTQIRETADLISRTISEAAFPASTDENAISELVKISEATILLYNFRLVYHIALSLIDFNTYQLFKASPWPVLQRTVNKSNNFAYIWPSSQYFAVSISKNTYINMDPKALGNCKKLNNKARALGQ